MQRNERLQHRYSIHSWNKHELEALQWRMVAAKVVRTHWKRSHITVSNIDTNVNNHYQPGGTVKKSTNTTSLRIVNKG